MFRQQNPTFKAARVEPYSRCWFKFAFQQHLKVKKKICIFHSLWGEMENIQREVKLVDNNLLSRLPPLKYFASTIFSTRPKNALNNFPWVVGKPNNNLNTLLSFQFLMLFNIHQLSSYK